MDDAKRRRLEADGWRVGDAEEFLELAPEEVALNEAQKAELDRRLADLQRDSEPGEPWDVARARVEKRLEDDFGREAARRTLDRSEW